ncbi:antitermination Q family protein [Enterobacter hormaechei]|uniref:Antitermination Q family protein n=3 Tax=Enterobacterales TaxID=91347 RepID=A0ABD7KT86_9ENTR|nr:hypothetical protein SK53_02309 [Enterobacter sp. MGH119]CZU17039.1 antitermination Q family protein [Enterobacter hormaechei]CZU78809.1 antitermination Q family protein [Enterobacter hormaechei]CZW38767.1 antitermination Q family protein [Enterobacter hormaechei]CZY43420.1 antitermination Q family protein [Enterobacter hormaechei]
MKLKAALKHFSPQGMHISDKEQERETAMRDMYEVMDRWGAWAASDHNGVDWQPIAAGFKGLLPHGKKSRPQCNDDEGIMIDGCVARLKKFKPNECELLIAHFVIGISLRAIAKKRKVSDGTIRKELQTAMGFIDGCICMLS